MCCQIYPTEPWQPCSPKCVAREILQKPGNPGDQSVVTSYPHLGLVVLATRVTRLASYNHLGPLVLATLVTRLWLPAILTLAPWSWQPW